MTSVLFVLSVEIRAARRKRQRVALAVWRLTLTPSNHGSSNTVEKTETRQYELSSQQSNYCRADNKPIFFAAALWKHSFYVFFNQRSGSIVHPKRVTDISVYTWGLASTLVCFKSVAVLAVAAEGAPLIKAVLAAESGGAALIDVLAGFGVIAQLKTHRARALGPKRPLNAAVSAAGVVVRTALLI